MKIGIDARLYGPKSRGIGRYLQNLIENLEKIDSENRYVVFLCRDNWDEYEPASPNFKKVRADYKEYGWQEQILFPAAIRREEIDLMHFPHFNVPFLYGKKFVVTVHDLIPLRFSGKETTTRNIAVHAMKRAFLRVVFRAAVRKAERIIAVSEHTKKDIVDYFGVNPEKVRVVYEGKPEVKPISGGSDKGRGLKINRPYMLYVGAAYPHKNLEKLLEAFELLDGPERLVLVGQKDYFYSRLEERAKNMGLSDRVIFAGYVPDEDLALLYEKAELYVFPSLAEGFGLPPLEAMARGVPVASSDASCMPEILGDAARYFDPRDAGDMAEKIRGILDGKKSREALKERGKERIEAFSWEKCAEETLKIYLKER